MALASANVGYVNMHIKSKNVDKSVTIVVLGSYPSNKINALS
jgi:hypothetical protein